MTQACKDIAAATKSRTSAVHADAELAPRNRGAEERVRCGEIQMSASCVRTSREKLGDSRPFSGG